MFDQGNLKQKEYSLQYFSSVKNVTIASSLFTWISNELSLNILLWAQSSLYLKVKKAER